MEKPIVVLLMILSLNSCKKDDAETLPSAITGRWVFFMALKNSNVHVIPYPQLSYNSTGGVQPDKVCIIDIGVDGNITMSVDGNTILEEDIYTDQIDKNEFRIHYYGSRKSRNSQYFDVFAKNDTMIISNFFPYVGYSEHQNTGHAGTDYTYDFVNFFVRQ